MNFKSWCSKTFYISAVLAAVLGAGDLHAIGGVQNGENQAEEGLQYLKTQFNMMKTRIRGMAIGEDNQSEVDAAYACLVQIQGEVQKTYLESFNDVNLNRNQIHILNEYLDHLKSAFRLRLFLKARRPKIDEIVSSVISARRDNNQWEVPVGKLSLALTGELKSKIVEQYAHCTEDAPFLKEAAAKLPEENPFAEIPVEEARKYPVWAESATGHLFIQWNVAEASDVDPTIIASILPPTPDVLISSSDQDASLALTYNRVSNFSAHYITSEETIKSMHREAFRLAHDKKFQEVQMKNFFDGE